MSEGGLYNLSHENLKPCPHNLNPALEIKRPALDQPLCLASRLRKILNSPGRIKSRQALSSSVKPKNIPPSPECLFTKVSSDGPSMDVHHSFQSKAFLL